MSKTADEPFVGPTFTGGSSSWPMSRESIRIPKTMLLSLTRDRQLPTPSTSPLASPTANIFCVSKA